jgi:hypothetical protein
MVELDDWFALSDLRVRVVHDGRQNAPPVGSTTGFVPSSVLADAQRP